MLRHHHVNASSSWNGYPRRVRGKDEASPANFRAQARTNSKPPSRGAMIGRDVKSCGMAGILINASQHPARVTIALGPTRITARIWAQLFRPPLPILQAPFMIKMISKEHALPRKNCAAPAGLVVGFQSGDATPESGVKILLLQRWYLPETRMIMVLRICSRAPPDRGSWFLSLSLRQGERGSLPFPGTPNRIGHDGFALLGTRLLL